MFDIRMMTFLCCVRLLSLITNSVSLWSGLGSVCCDPKAFPGLVSMPDTWLVFVTALCVLDRQGHTS